MKIINVIITLLIISQTLTCTRKDHHGEEETTPAEAPGKRCLSLFSCGGGGGGGGDGGGVAVAEKLVVATVRAGGCCRRGWSLEAQCDHRHRSADT